MENFNYYISTQKPNADLNTFQGYVTTFKTDENVKKGLRNDNIIYRGCALRNTDSIKGLVIYAGCNAKAMLSNQGIFHKTSKLEKLMNRDIILFAALLLILSISAAVASMQVQKSDKDSNWYIPYVPIERDGR